MHAHRGRPAGMTRGRILKRLIIVEALVQGIKIAAVARRLGVSRSWASREANAPETRLMLVALFERHAQRMGQLLDQALTTIEVALQATKQIRFSGQVLEIPDHRIRLEAAGLLVRLLATGPFSYRPGQEPRLSLSDERACPIEHGCSLQDDGSIRKLQPSSYPYAGFAPDVGDRRSQTGG